MPCGGAVDAEVTLNKEIVDSQRGIIGYGRIIIPNPSITSRYYIRILSLNREELGKTSGVEVNPSKHYRFFFNNSFRFTPPHELLLIYHYQKYLRIETLKNIYRYVLVIV